MSRAVGLALALACVAPVLAQPAAVRDHAVAPKMKISLEGRVTQHTLKNGMTFLLLERHQSPTVSCVMQFRVGAVDEWDGVGGTAHLLEHMLFKGTHTIGTKDWNAESKILAEIDKVGEEYDRARLKAGPAGSDDVKRLSEQLGKLQKEAGKFVIKDELSELYKRNGGVGLNATTSLDFTNYFLSLPANKLPLWCRIESDRMTQPILREFYTERDVVQEERRRKESDPSNILWQEFISTSFRGHRYGYPVLGWPAEIAHVSKESVERFFRIFYAPNNTVVALVGDFNTAELVPMLDTYFSAIPPQTLPRPVARVELEQRGERRLQVEADANPELIMGWHKPCAPERVDNVFDVIDGILTTGRTSRLYKKLVDETQLATSVGSTSGTPGNRFPNLFEIAATPRAPHTNAEVEAAIETELQRLRDELVSPTELRRIKNQIQGSFIRGLDSNMGLARKLVFYQLLFGDWHHAEKQMDVYESITAEEIRDAARKYFTKKNRTVAELVQVKPAKEASK